MKLDYVYQFQLLEWMAETYPAPYNILAHTNLFMGVARLKYIANVTYLEAHGLIESGLQQSPTGHLIGSPTITHKGMDYLSDDGGLSAHLNVVNVRFVDDDFREIERERTSEVDITLRQKFA